MPAQTGSKKRRKVDVIRPSAGSSREFREVRIRLDPDQFDKVIRTANALGQRKFRVINRAILLGWLMQVRTDEELQLVLGLQERLTRMAEEQGVSICEIVYQSFLVYEPTKFLPQDVALLVQLAAQRKMSVRGFVTEAAQFYAQRVDLEDDVGAGPLKLPDSRPAVSTARKSKNSP